MKIQTCLFVFCFLALTLLSIRPAAAYVLQKQDFLAGNGTVGPYFLSWNHILYGSEQITLDDIPLHWGADYTLNARKGTITFTHPLAVHDAAIVDYDYDSVMAHPQGQGVTVPLTVALGESASISGNYNRAAGDNSDPGSVDFGLNSNWHNTHGSGLTTHLLFLPAMTGKDAKAAANGLARLGIALDAKTALGRFTQVGFGFSRAGAGLDSGAGNHWQAGQQKINIDGKFSPSRKMHAALGYTQNDSATPGTGPSQSQINAGLSLNPSQSSELAATYSDRSTQGTHAGTQAMGLNAALHSGKSISLTASLAETSQNSGETHAVTQTIAANADLKPTKDTDIEAVFSDNTSPGQTDNLRAFNIRAGISRGNQAAFSADMKNSRQGSQEVNQQSVQLALTPRSAFKFTSGVALCQGPLADTATASLGGALTPSRYLQFSGGYQWRSSTPLEPKSPLVYDTSHAQVVFAPLAAFHLVGTYAQNPDDSAGTPQRLAEHGLSLQTHLGALNLRGGYEWTRQYASDTTAANLEVGMGLHFSANTLLTGSYRHDLTAGPTSGGGTDAYTLGLTRDLGRAFDLSINGTLRRLADAPSAPPTNMTASADLGLKF